jgi:hypothetical protein
VSDFDEDEAYNDPGVLKVFAILAIVLALAVVAGRFLGHP